MGIYSEPENKERDSETLNQIKSWPQPEEIPLRTIKFSKERPFALGTDFSIGRRVVVTAGHVIDDWTATEVENYRSVVCILEAVEEEQYPGSKCFLSKFRAHFTGKECKYH